jgi:hypothetical protein
VAQKTVVELVDDLDGGKADETVAFAIDGVDFLIDLSAENATRLRESLAEFVGHARKTGTKRGKAAAGRKAQAADKPDNQAIREWARSQGETIAERGRIPQALVMRFQEAHS